MSLFAADAVYDMSAAGLETFEGTEAIRGFVEDWGRNWEDYRYVLAELVDHARRLPRDRRLAKLGLRFT
ncbi:MAG TPA: hypothetical protein VGH09_08840 [Solirubrobacteraceae bacterium]|jgi:hypothetical protein